MSRLTELAKTFYDLQRQKETLEEQLKEVNKQIISVSQNDIPNAMQDAEVEKVTIEGIGTMSLRYPVYVNVPADQKEAAYDWLKNNGHGDLIVQYVHPQTLKAFAGEQLENGNPLPDCIQAKIIPTATIRRK